MIERTVNDVTVEALNDLFNEEHQCDAILSFYFRFNTRVLIDKEWACPRKAQHMVLLSCSAHGAQRKNVCQRHLLLLHSGRGRLYCAACNQPAVWKSL